MNPSDIAKSLSENVRQRNGLITEDLYGKRIVPGDSPIDQLIAFVEREYIEWDLKDKRFQRSVVNYLGQVPTTAGAWMILLSKSVQSDDLKQLLMNKLNLAPVSSKTDFIPTGQGPFEIYFKRGTKETVDRIEVSNNNPELYFAASIKGTQHPSGLYGKDRANRPAVLGKVVSIPRAGRPHSTRVMWVWFYERIITFNKSNVIRVVSMKQKP